MTKTARAVYEAMTRSSDIPHDVQAALRKLIDDGKLRGFLLATYGADPRASWRAKPTDMLNTIMTLVEFITENPDVAKRVGDLVAINIKLPDAEVN